MSRCVTCSGEGARVVDTGEREPETGAVVEASEDCPACAGSGVTCEQCGTGVAEVDLSPLPGPDLCGRCQDKVGTDNPPAEQWS